MTHFDSGSERVVLVTQNARVTRRQPRTASTNKITKNPLQKDAESFSVSVDGSISQPPAYHDGASEKRP